MANQVDKTMKEMSTSGLPGSSTLPDGSVVVGPDIEMVRVESEEDLPHLVYPSKRRVGQHSFQERKSIDMDEEEVVETKRSRNALIEKPVENSGPVPLMPNLDANARHVITAIRVSKRTPPNDGIKGDVPESTTLEFIARRWGDGIYDFEALNEAGQVLRRNVNVKVAMGFLPSSESQPTSFQKLMMPSSQDGFSEKLLERLDDVSKRAHQSSEAALTATQKLSQDYASMVREDSKDRASKDREYHDAQTKQQTGFFQTMLVSMQTMHEQAMERAQQQFQQTMQMMQFSHQQTLQQNNPALMFQLFERGLRFGAEASGGEEENPLTSILGAATEGLSTVKDMMMLQRPASPAILPSAPSTVAPAAAENKAKKKLPISKAELMEVLRLKKIAESRGLKFDGLVKQAQAMVANMPAEMSEPEEPEPDDEDEEADSESDGTSDVD